MITELYYGGWDLWAYTCDDSENMNVASVLQDSASNSSLEFNFVSHIYKQNTLSGNDKESFNIEMPSDEEYVPTDVLDSETEYEPSDPSMSTCLVYVLDQGLCWGSFRNPNT